MKKSFAFGLFVVMALAVSVTAFSSGSSSEPEYNHCDRVHVESTTQGSGSCRHALCKCTSYTRAEGGAGKCTCGHWDYVHN